MCLEEMLNVISKMTGVGGEGKKNGRAFNLKICLKHIKKWDMKFSRITIINYRSHLYEYSEWYYGEIFRPSVDLLIPKLYFYLLHSPTQRFTVPVKIVIKLKFQ